jgi:hypothetical protein
MMHVCMHISCLLQAHNYLHIYLNLFISQEIRTAIYVQVSSKIFFDNILLQMENFESCDCYT